jgi:hypothetical protein
MHEKYFTSEEFQKLATLANSRQQVSCTARVSSAGNTYLHCTVLHVCPLLETHIFTVLYVRRLLETRIYTVLHVCPLLETHLHFNARVSSARNMYQHCTARVSYAGNTYLHCIVCVSSEVKNKYELFSYEKTF